MLFAETVDMDRNGIVAAITHTAKPQPANHAWHRTLCFQGSPDYILIAIEFQADLRTDSYTSSAFSAMERGEKREVFPLDFG